MTDALTVINRVISEHHAIRAHVRLAGDSVNDIEALAAMHRAQSAWSQTAVATLTDKQNELVRSINFLEEGLNNHFDYEEKELLPLFGELLGKAFINEHREISERLNNAKKDLGTTKIEDLEQPDSLSKKSDVLRNINNLTQAIEEHAGHEETILNMMKNALAKDKTRTAR